MWRPSAATRKGLVGGATAAFIACLVALLSLLGATSASAAQSYPTPRSASLSIQIVQKGNCFHVIGSLTSDSGRPTGRIDSYLDGSLIKSFPVPSSGKFDIPIGCDPKTRASTGCGSNTRVGGLAPGMHNVTVKYVPTGNWSAATASRNFLVKAKACQTGNLPTGVDAGLAGVGPGAGADHSLRILLDVLALLTLAGLCYGYRRSGDEPAARC